MNDKSTSKLIPLQDALQQLRRVLDKQHLDVAYRIAQDIIQTAPHNSDHFFQIAKIFQEAEQYAAAITYYQQGLKLDPHNISQLTVTGVLCFANGQLTDAEHYLQRALALQPQAGCYFNLGCVYQKLHHHQRTITHFQKAIELDPCHVRAMSNLSSEYFTEEKFAQAIYFAESAIRIDPKHPTAYVVLGCVYHKLQQYDKAIDYLQQSLVRAPEDVNNHTNLGMMLLLAGNYQQGWQEYLWRQQLKLLKRDFEKPQWQGENFVGKTLLLHVEQGFGDTINFSRYIPLIKARGGTVIVECHGVLLKLINSIAGVDRIFPQGVDIKGVHYDYYLPLLNACHIFDAKPGNIPLDVPYLKADKSIANYFNKLLGHEDKFRIGIAWAGNPAHGNDKNRSCGIELFIKYLQHPAIQLYSLQKSDRSQDAKPYLDSGKMIDLQQHIHDFSDSAAFMLNFDLIITVDTAPCHLAGALGLPIWTLLPINPDWRWGQTDDSSYWYPTMRLYRQSVDKDWESVFAIVRRDLFNDYLKKRNCSDILPASKQKAFLETVMQHQQGEFALAEKAYQCYLQQYPRHADSLYYLGVIAMQKQAYDLARPLIESAIQLRSNQATYYQHWAALLHHQDQHYPAMIGEYYCTLLTDTIDNNLIKTAETLFSAGEYVDAMMVYQRLITLQPDDPVMHYHLALTYLTLQRHDEAVASLQQALVLNDEFFQAYFRLGLIYLQQHFYQGAIEKLQTALVLQPDDVAARYHLAIALQGIAQYQQAITHLQLLLANAPDHEQGHLLLSDLYAQVDDFSQAIAVCRHYIALQPQAVKARIRLATIYQALNQVNEALAVIAEGEKLAADDADLRILKARCYDQQGNSQQALALLKSLDHKILNSQQAQISAFDLGCYYHQLQQFEEAYHQYYLANWLQRDVLLTDYTANDVCLSQAETFIDASETKENSRKMTEAVVTTHPRPIFLLDFPGSGASVLQSMLGAHPQVQILADKSVFKAILETLDAPYSRAITQLSSQQRQLLQRDYFQQCAQYLALDEQKVFINKLPGNVFYLGLLNMIFPDSCLIVMRRHPCDVCLSAFMQPFYLNNATDNLFTLEEIAHSYGEFCKLLAYYQQSRQGDDYEVGYEDLVDNMQLTLTPLLAQLGLQWHDDINDYHNSVKPTVVVTPNYQQLMRPTQVYEKFAWQRYRAQLSTILPRLAPLVTKLGYEI